MENTMNTNVDGDGGMAQMPCDIVLTGEPFFIAVEEGQQADGTREIVLHSEGLVQLRAIPPAVERVTVPPKKKVFGDRGGNGRGQYQSWFVTANVTSTEI